VSVDRLLAKSLSSISASRIITPGKQLRQCVLPRMEATWHLLAMHQKNLFSDRKHGGLKVKCGLEPTIEQTLLSGSFQIEKYSGSPHQLLVLIQRKGVYRCNLTACSPTQSTSVVMNPLASFANADMKAA